MIVCRRVAVFVCLLLASMPWLAPVPANAAFPGHNGAIVYTTDYFGNTDVVVYPNGTVVDLTNSPENDSGPTYSADGQRIVWAAGGDIWSMWSDGTHHRQLTSSTANDSFPAYSPDRTHIVWSRKGELYLMHADGSHRHVLGPQLANPLNGVQAAWSPDGRWIAFSAYTNGNTRLDIFRVHPDGTGLRNLTRNRSLFNSGPDWSPDSKTIAYAQQSTFTSGVLENIELMDADGTHAISVLQVDLDVAGGGPVAFSPNGRQLAYSAYGSNDSSAHIWKLTLSTGATTQITSCASCFDVEPNWQPT